MRLWDAEVDGGAFDLAAHNASRYDVSVGPATLAFELTAVLYPGDGTREGKALRVKQQYMLCSASVQARALCLLVPPCLPSSHARP